MYLIDFVVANRLSIAYSYGVQRHGWPACHMHMGSHDDEQNVPEINWFGIPKDMSLKQPYVYQVTGMKMEQKSKKAESRERKKLHCTCCKT